MTFLRAGLFLLGSLAVLILQPMNAGATAVSGRVVDATTQEALGAVDITLQGTQVSTRTTEDGEFVLELGDFDPADRQVTAWRKGYSIAAAPVTGQMLNLSLETLPPDNASYDFQGASTCGACHTDIYAQWLNTSMGRATGEKLPQKMQFYLGTNDAGKFDGFGFGWKYFAPMMGISQGIHAMDLDHYIGTCNNCHARGATWKMGELEPHRKLNPYSGKVFVDGSLDVFRFDKLESLTIAQGREGLTCDVCHSVEDVRIHHDQFGSLETVKIAKMEIIRRGDTKFGPFKDAVSPFHKTAYSPIFEKSEFCAMCHTERADDLEGVGVQALLTLDEYPRWKANFDAGKTNQQCQGCHMYTGGHGEWSANKAALMGPDRQPESLFGHHWRGSYFDGEMAKRASNLKLSVRRSGDELAVAAEVANVGAAHKMPGGPPFRQMLLVIEATDAQGHPLKPLDVPRADPLDADHANRIIDVGGGYRKYGVFQMWSMMNGRPFPDMPYVGSIGKVYNGSWVTPSFFPMEWAFKYLLIGVVPLLIGLAGWSPLRAALGSHAKEGTKAGFLAANLGTIDRLLRIFVGVALLIFVPMPWALVALVPLATGMLGRCPTYHLIGGVDTCETSGFFARNVGTLDRALRIAVGLAILMMAPSPWHWFGVVPLVSGVLGWCPTYRLIGNVSTLHGGRPGLFEPNIGGADRLLRALVGLGLLSLLFWGPETPWGALGLIPLFTAVMGNCLPYRLAAMDTRSAEECTTTGRPWMNLSFSERRTRMVVGLVLLALAVVLPKAAAIHMWPVGGFAAEQVLYDTRIDYRDSDTTHYRFAAPKDGPAMVKARLIYYRHWYFMEALKGPKFWGTDKWKYLLHELKTEVPAQDGSSVSIDAGNHDGDLRGMPKIPSTPGAGAWTAEAASQKAAVDVRQAQATTMKDGIQALATDARARAAD